MSVPTWSSEAADQARFFRERELCISLRQRPEQLTRLALALAQLLLCLLALGYVLADAAHAYGPPTSIALDRPSAVTQRRPWEFRRNSSSVGGSIADGCPKNRAITLSRSPGWIVFDHCREVARHGAFRPAQETRDGTC